MKQATLLLLFLPLFTWCQDSLYSASEKPLLTHEDNPQEIGIIVTSSKTGKITHIKFYCVDPGQYTVTIWSKTGSIFYSSKMQATTGWQRFALATPFEVAAGDSYIVSYLTNMKFGYSKKAIVRSTGSIAKLGTRSIYGHKFPPATSTLTDDYYIDVIFQAEQPHATLIVNAGRDTAAVWPCDSIQVHGVATGDSVKYIWTLDNQWGDVALSGLGSLTPVVRFKEPDSGAILVLTATDKWGNTSEHGVSVSVMPDFEPYIKRFGELIMNQLRLDMIRKWKAGE